MKILLVALLLSAAPGLFSGDVQWYASHSSLLLRELLAAWLIYHLTKHPAALLWLVLCAWDVALIPMWLWAPDTHSAINWFIWPVALLFATYHLYILQPDIHNDHTYLAFRRPHTTQGWLLAAFGIPGGSISILSGGSVYGFHGGKLTRRGLRNPGKYVIIPMSTKTTKRLDEIVGSKWQIRNNCITLAVRARLWTL